MSNNEMSKDHDNEKDYLKELAPSLFEKKIEAEDRAPNRYFETLGDRVMNRIDAENSHRQNVREKKVVKLVNWKNVGVAATIAAVIATAQFFYMYTQQDDPVADKSEISIPQDFGSRTVEDYLSEEDIYDAFAASDIRAGEILTDEEIIEEDIIIEYLLQEDLSEELIIEELES